MLTELEALKSVICAAQARSAAQLASSQRACQRAAGVPAKHCGRGVAAQVALARGESPHHGGKLLGAAEALLTEMPHTLTALAHGSLNEWRAMLLIRESACLTRTDRALLDQQISSDHRYAASGTDAWSPAPAPSRNAWTPPPLSAAPAAPRPNAP
ncbi:hypothetical protein FH969_12075 [Miniimonas arenae]|uniref:DUF222 domain-containing protein n=1 Tax=Miniimonas arenae TaxID=676201 RepID=A0A5C5B9U1_9MICO|nr:hypothetical protein [Miniimonas arenae]TNU73289.1 hypothetical protein FH969_12075 [Miniimonas arenae]